MSASVQLNLSVKPLGCKWCVVVRLWVVWGNIMADCMRSTIKAVTRYAITICGALGRKVTFWMKKCATSADVVRKTDAVSAQRMRQSVATTIHFSFANVSNGPRSTPTCWERCCSWFHRLKKSCRLQGWSLPPLAITTALDVFLDRLQKLWTMVFLADPFGKSWPLCQGE